MNDRSVQTVSIRNYLDTFSFLYPEIAAFPFRIRTKTKRHYKQEERNWNVHKQNQITSIFYHRCPENYTKSSLVASFFIPIIL